MFACLYMYVKIHILWSYGCFWYIIMFKFTFIFIERERIVNHKAILQPRRATKRFEINLVAGLVQVAASKVSRDFRLVYCLWRRQQWMDRQEGVQCIALIIGNGSASWSMLQLFFPHVVVVWFHSELWIWKLLWKLYFRANGNSYEYMVTLAPLTLRSHIIKAQRLRQSPHTLQLPWHGMIINQNCFCAKLMLGKTTKTWNGDGMIGIMGCGGCCWESSTWARSTDMLQTLLLQKPYFFYGHFSCCTMQSRSLWQREFTNKISWRRWLDQVKLTATWSNIASMSVRSPVTKTLWPVSHVNPMGSAKDTKQDDLVDMQEFAEWLTNVNATITVGLLASKLRRPWVIPF